MTYTLTPHEFLNSVTQGLKAYYGHDFVAIIAQSIAYPYNDSQNRTLVIAKNPKIWDAPSEPGMYISYVPECSGIILDLHERWRYAGEYQSATDFEFSVSELSRFPLIDVFNAMVCNYQLPRRNEKVFAMHKMKIENALLHTSLEDDINDPYIKTLRENVQFQKAQYTLIIHSIADRLKITPSAFVDLMRNNDPVNHPELIVA